ncbi:hypothetical protein L539_3466 [Bordetella hinzii 5132]|uniref:hypothetical protein n=1 Tax=Bordetella hinzii TaxID=103855 RepID=UPI00045ADA7B|nr:hypothetical protein [Bordetella hinzii]KCB41273.1 hypothetical protein L539_3466 [Bordetella hinzii 5132]
MIAFEEQIKFRILCDEEVSSDVCSVILKKILDSETNFKVHCRNYVIKVDKKSADDMKEIIVDEFSVFPAKYFYSLTAL